MNSNIFRQTTIVSSVFSALVILTGGYTPKATGQETAGSAIQVFVQNPVIEIPEIPKTIDPATLIGPQLAAKVTVRFDGDPLKKVFQWLQQEQSINVLVDYKGLASAKLLETEPVYEELNDAPLYLLLNRMERMGLAWYERDGSLFITSREEFLKHDRTLPYNLSDLIDNGYSPKDLINAIKRRSGGQWASTASREGAAILLGDVVFIRQTDDVHREIAGILAALRNHSRRTLTFDAPNHESIRNALELKIDVDFQETPLIVAAQELSRLTMMPIRLDRVAVMKGAVRERTPVTLKMTQQKLGAVLRGILSHIALDWYLRDEVLWITTADAAGSFHKTAVFDVRDLCADKAEGVALKLAIEAQTRAKWQAGSEGGGILEIPKPGVLMARHSEPALDEVLQMLENFRTALKVSKLRVEPVPDPTEVVTGYYQLTERMASDLLYELPNLVSPETWQSEQQPDGIGKIKAITGESSQPDSKGNAIQRMILVIEQSRAAHQKIGKLINALVNSRPVDTGAGLDLKKGDSTSSSFGRNLILKPVK